MKHNFTYIRAAAGAGALIALASGLFAAGACASKHAPPPPPMAIRLAVLDFAPPSAAYHDKGFNYARREGWWFGSENIYSEASVGVHAADAISQRLNRAELITVYSRYDFRHYMADKADRLRKQFSDLTDAQIHAALSKALQDNPLEIGRELEVDRVLTGQILDERMSMNRTSKFWKSHVAVRVVMWDVGKRDVVFDHTFKVSKWFASMQMTLESLADEVAGYLRSNYGYK